MKISGQNKPQGIALFIVMIAIFVLSVMAAIFALSMKVEMKLAQNAEHKEELLWLGRSGVEYCRWVLSQENCPYDALNQVWAGGSGSECDTNLAVQNPVQVGDGSFTWTIIDLERKININTASPAELRQVLTVMGVDADSISIISDSILDWISPGDNPRLAGAKSDYYQTLNPPYYCKDAPMDDPSELLLVRGIWDHPEIYSGGGGNNQEPAVFRQKLGFENSPFQAQNYSFGLSNIFTALSSGHINILTAGTNVLQMLPGVNDEIAENIVKVRAGPDGVDGTEDDPAFASPAPILSAAGAPAGDAKFCTVRSSTFEVDVKARIGDYHREYVAILYRNSPADIKVLSFYWK